MNKNWKEICKFQSEHERTGCIALANEKCDVCKKFDRCITIDSSEGEYGTGNICFVCMMNAFSEKEIPENTIIDLKAVIGALIKKIDIIHNEINIVDAKLNIFEELYTLVTKDKEHE